MCNIEKFVNDCVSGHLCGAQCSQRPSVHCFDPIRVLGEGGFGKVVLARQKALNGRGQLLAIKAVRKDHIRSLKLPFLGEAERGALILASGHPFVTTFHACFQTKVSLNFLNLNYCNLPSV